MGCEERRGISGGEGIAPTQGLNLKASSIPFHKIEKRILRSVLAFFLVFFLKRMSQIRFTKTRNGFQLPFHCFFFCFNECVFSSEMYYTHEN